jgi:hypothetical protein
MKTTSHFVHQKLAHSGGHQPLAFTHNLHNRTSTYHAADSTF